MPIREGKTLLTWFGSIAGHGTIGDLLAIAAVSRELKALGIDFSILNNHENTGSFFSSYESVHNPSEFYKAAAFICGPIIRDHPTMKLFAGGINCRRSFGVGISLMDRSSDLYTQPFTQVLAREGAHSCFGDLAALSLMESGPRDDSHPAVTRVGVVLRGVQHEYGPDRCLDDLSRRHFRFAIERLSSTRMVEVVPIEHHLGRMLSTPEEVLSLYKTCSIVLTTRFHGAVLALLSGVPCVAIDQIAGGAKVSGLLGRIHWPHVYVVDRVEPEHIAGAVLRLVDGEANLALMHSQNVARAEAQRTMSVFTSLLLAD